MAKRSRALEGLAMNLPMSGTGIDPAFWRGRRVLVTGHTGFIGGWTTAWLHSLGAIVTGYALLPPTTPSFYALSGLGTRVRGIVADIRSADALAGVFADTSPDVVLHFAAQPLVRVGYETPVETFSVNLMGTVNVLDSIRRNGAQAVVVMTSDKVYGSRDDAGAHVEDDRLAGSDPYSGSKCCCELAAVAYGRCYLEGAGIGLATVRAGNVIGGGDWAADRLVPDAVRVFSAGKPLALRRPRAVRSWQHVLDAVSGVLLVAQEAVRRRAPIGAWNIGPETDRAVTVGTLAALMARAWGEGAKVVDQERADFPETEVLTLNASRIQRELGFRCVWSLKEAVEHTVAWYKRALAGEDAWAVTARQIEEHRKSGREMLKPVA